MIDRENFIDKLVKSKDMKYLSAYWFANCIQYIEELEARIEKLEKQIEENRWIAY